MFRFSVPKILQYLRCLLLNTTGVPAVGGLKFSMAQKKVKKSASWLKCQLGEVPVGGIASSGKCQFGD